MQETCRCSTDLAMPSNIRLENKIGNPRTIRERYKKPKQRIDRSVWNRIWTQKQHVLNGLVTEASLRLISYFFYFISILLFPLNRKQPQEKKTVAKHKREPSRTLHGRKTEKTVSRKNSLEKYKSRFSNKKC
jgi:hypothetical protein